MSTSIYVELIDKVNKGERFSCDFKKKNLKVGKHWLIKEGVWNNERKLGVYASDTTDCLRWIECLYQDYKYSVPSEFSEKRRRTYFKAVTADELSDEQLVWNKPREYARASLEGYILCSVLTGLLQWDEEAMGTWFWQSEADPDLVILRQWVETK